MRSSDAEAIIEARIKAIWPTVHPAVPAIFTNDLRPSFDEAPNVMHVEIRWGADRIASFGGIGENRHRQSGEVVLRCFVQSIIDGRVLPSTMADDAGDMFRSFRSGDLIFFEVGAAAGEQSDQDGDFFQRDAIASFTLDIIG